MRVLAFVLAVSTTVFCQTARYKCEPDPKVAAAISQVEDLRRTAAPDLFRGRAREVMAAVVREQPGDVFANLRYLHLFSERGHPDVIDRYHAAMEANPGDPLYELYYAASLIGTDTPAALRRLTALTNIPSFPYPYLLIGEIRSYPKFQDRAAASANLIRFVKACPAYLPAYELLSSTGSGDELNDVARTLRRLLSGRTDTDRATAVAYRWLWALEFRATPPTEHDSMRARIEDDLARLRKRYTMDDAAVVETFRTGYLLAENTRFMPRLPNPAPTSDLMHETQSKWYRDHPYKQNASAEERAGDYRDLARASLAWIARWWYEPMPYLERFQALAQLPETAEVDLVTAGEALIAANRRRPRRYLIVPAVIDVARAYVDRGMKLDEVPGMIEVGLREADANQHVPEFDFLDDRNHRLNEEGRYQGHIQARSVEFDWSLKTANRPRARKALAAMRDDLDHLDAITTQPLAAQFFAAGYWMKMARLAELEGHGDDADKYRRTAEECRNAKPSSSANIAVVSALGTRLPPFRASGIDGRLWTTADLDGKVAVMNLWATWCAPCVAELPHLQKLYERLKSRQNVVVLALNVDSNPGVVAPFLRGRGYTFPIVLADDYVERALPNPSIPRTWVVESGIIRSEQTGVVEPEQWLAEVMTKVEEAQRRP